MTRANKMTIRFRGVRGSIPSPSHENMRYGGNTSCVEIRHENQILILDAGSGIRRLGDELLQQSGPIEAALLLSHTHWDHVQGLPFFAPGYSPKNRITIFAGPGRGEPSQRALAAQMTPLHFPGGLEQMRGLELIKELSPEETKFGSLLVRTIPLNHPGGCTGFRIQSAAGHVAYLPDHEPYRSNGGTSDRLADSAHRELVEFIRGVDLLILDTQYTAEEYVHKVGWGHGCLPNSVELAIEAGVRRLFLFHHDPSHDDRKLDQMVESAHPLASHSSLAIEAASENEIVSLTSSTAGIIPEIGFVPLHPISFPQPVGRLEPAS